MGDSARKRTVSAVASKADATSRGSMSGARRASLARTGRRLREAADRFDDAIEFESPEGAGVHER